MQFKFGKTREEYIPIDSGRQLIELLGQAGTPLKGGLMYEDILDDGLSEESVSGKFILHTTLAGNEAVAVFVPGFFDRHEFQGVVIDESVVAADGLGFICTNRKLKS